MKLSSKGSIAWSVFKNSLWNLFFLIPSFFFFCFFFFQASPFILFFLQQPLTPSFFLLYLLPMPPTNLTPFLLPTHLPPFLLPTHLPPSSYRPTFPTLVLQSLHHQQVEHLGLGRLELEEWRAWSLRSEKFGSMSLKVSTLFLFLFLFFLFWFWWAPSPTFDRS